jgi:hypothetical protein
VRTATPRRFCLAAGRRITAEGLTDNAPVCSARLQTDDEAVFKRLVIERNSNGQGFTPVNLRRMRAQPLASAR